MRMNIRNKNKGFTLIELMIVVAIVGVLAVLAIVGVRRYLANAKTAEARNSLGAIGKGAAQALERELSSGSIMAAGGTGAITRRLCLSASAMVPTAVASISGKKYQANTGANDYGADVATQQKGFACVRFELTAPQYYQYNYLSDSTATSIGTNVSATAIGDLNGDAVYSTFTLLGAVRSNALVIGPALDEVSPEE